MHVIRDKYSWTPTHTRLPRNTGAVCDFRLVLILNVVTTYWWTRTWDHPQTYGPNSFEIVWLFDCLETKKGDRMGKYGWARQNGNQETRVFRKPRYCTLNYSKDVWLLSWTDLDKSKVSFLIYAMSCSRLVGVSNRFLVFSTSLLLVTEAKISDEK